MTAAELVRELESRGVSLMTNDGELSYRAPKGVLSDIDRDAVRTHLDELIEMLTALPSPDAASDLPQP